MGEFLITGPDGKKYKVTGDNPQGAVAALKKMLGQNDNPRQAMIDRIAAAKAGTLEMQPGSAQRAAEMDQQALDAIALSRVPTGYAPLVKAVEGVPFIGSYADEAMGAVGSGLEAVGLAPAGTGQQMTNVVRQTSEAYQRQNPVASTALQIGGGIAASIPAAIAAAPSVVAAAPAALGGRVLAGIGAGALAGGTEGAVSGYGRGQGDNRMATAAQDGLLGAAFGGLVGGAAPAIGAGIKSIVERFKGRDVTAIAKTLNISPDAARAVKFAVENDDFDAARAALKAAGADAMLADAGAGGARMLDTATKSSGAAARIAADAIEPRAVGARGKLEVILDSVLGPYDGIKSAAKGIASRTSAVRKMAYDRAYAQPIDYSTGAAGEAILNVLDRIPPKTVGAAIAEANDAMRAAGIKNMQILADVADDGSVIFREMPNVRQVDEIKKALGTIAADQVDQFGRPNAAGIRAGKLATDLRDALSAAVPGYGTAVKLGGDKIAEDRALELGKGLLTGNVSREAVGDFVAGNPSREALSAAKQGLRTFIDDTLASVKRTVADPNTDAREAVKLIKDMSSRANMEKVTAVLGDKSAARLFKTLDEATAAIELRSTISRNSDTYGRTAMDRAVRDIVEIGPVGYLKQGKPLEAGRRFIQILSGATKEADQAKMQSVYAEIAKALTSIRGPQAELAINAIEKAIAGQPLKSADAARIARVLSTSAALTGYQTGTRSLSSPSSGR